MKIGNGSTLIVAGLFFLTSNCFLSAQTKHTAHPTHPKVSITGCLQNGDEAGEYSMKTSDGKMYGLTSRRVPLKEHVGHTVMLRGYIVPESAEKPEKGEPRETKSAAPADIDMTVTSLKMMSETCQK